MSTAPKLPPRDLAPWAEVALGAPPYVGFYYASREPLADPDKAYPFAPDLAVEVASPAQYRPGMKAKAERYLAGGTGVGGAAQAPTGRRVASQ